MGKTMIVRVDYNGRDDTGQSATLSFDDIESINVKRTTGDKPSRATIVLRNVPNRFISGFSQPVGTHVLSSNQLRFREGDSVKIYAAALDEFRNIDTSSGSADLLMSGEVAEFGIQLEQDKAQVKLEIIDKTYVMFNRVHTGAYRVSDGKGADDIIQEVVRAVTDDTDGDSLSYDTSGNLVSNGIFGADARLVSNGGFIEDERTDGSVFPALSYAQVAKPAYEWISELSSVDNTNDFETDDPNAPVQNRNMVFYVDELNKFHWFFPKDAVQDELAADISDSDTSLTLSDASDFAVSGDIFIGAERISYTGKTSNTLTGLTRGVNNTTASAHSTGDVVNTGIQITSGDTTNGHEVYAASLDKKVFDVVNFVIFNCGSDLNGNGITSYFFDRTTKNKTLKDTFKSYNEVSRNIIEAEIQDGNLVKDNSQNDFTYKGNFYKAAGSYPITTSWGTSVANNSEYNDAVRAQAIKTGKSKAQALTLRRASPRWKGNIELSFKRYPVGDVIEFTSTRGGLNKQPLRIKGATYQITKTGGFVTLDVEEDEAKLGEV